MSIVTYFLGLDRQDAVLDAGVANEQRYTIGTREFGRRGPIDYNFEFIYQFGHFGNRPISAFAAFSDTGFTIASAWGKPRIAVKADVASLYPSLMRQYQIGPERDRLGAMLSMVGQLVEQRLAAKARSRTESAQRRVSQRLQGAGLVDRLNVVRPTLVRAPPAPAPPFRA